MSDYHLLIAFALSFILDALLTIVTAVIISAYIRGKKSEARRMLVTSHPDIVNTEIKLEVAAAQRFPEVNRYQAKEAQVLLVTWILGYLLIYFLIVMILP